MVPILGPIGYSELNGRMVRSVSGDLHLPIRHD
jgi:hypothetical protein